MDNLVARGETALMDRHDWRSWVELGAGLAGGIVLYNLHPTRLGNALVSYKSLSAGQTQGISLEARVALYAVLSLIGALLVVASLIVRSNVRRPADAIALGRAAGSLCLAGIAGLALDYRDGPQAWVHTAVFVTMTLCAIRTVRVLGAELSIGDSDETPQRRSRSRSR